MNEYEQGKELSANARTKQEPTVINLDIKKVRLTDFMKVLGQEHPVAADGNLRIYNAPYDPKGEPTMVINTETNLWRDTKSGAYGGIYDLAYELTGSCNMSELNRYIAGQMQGLEKSQKLNRPSRSRINPNGKCAYDHRRNPQNPPRRVPESTGLSADRPRQQRIMVLFSLPQ